MYLNFIREGVCVEDEKRFNPAVHCCFRWVILHDGVVRGQVKRSRIAAARRMVRTYFPEWRNEFGLIEWRAASAVQRIAAKKGDRLTPELFARPMMIARQLQARFERCGSAVLS